jgi:hypothetical protein
VMRNGPRAMPRRSALATGAGDRSFADAEIARPPARLMDEIRHTDATA